MPPQKMPSLYGQSFALDVPNQQTNTLYGLPSAIMRDKKKHIKPWVYNYRGAI